MVFPLIGDHEYEYPPAPPLGVASAVPVFPPLHNTAVVLTLTLGAAKFVIVIEEEDAGQGLLLIVHCKVAVVPAVSVAVVLAKFKLEKFALPDATDHKPFPLAGVFAVNENVLLLHKEIFAPAFEGVGGVFTCTTVVAEEVQPVEVVTVTE